VRLVYIDKSCCLSAKLLNVTLSMPRFVLLFLSQFFSRIGLSAYFSENYAWQH